MNSMIETLNSNLSLIICEVHIYRKKNNVKKKQQIQLNVVLNYFCLATSIIMHFMRQTTECDAMNNSVDLQFLHFQHTHKIFFPIKTMTWKEGKYRKIQIITCV